MPLPFSADDEDPDFIPVHMLTAKFPADTKSIADFNRATTEDNVSSILMKMVVDCWPDSRMECHPLILDYWMILDYWSFRDKDSVEYRLLMQGYGLIFPKNLCNKVLPICHKGHF